MLARLNYRDFIHYLKQDRDKIKKPGHKGPEKLLTRRVTQQLHQRNEYRNAMMWRISSSVRISLVPKIGMCASLL